MLMEQFLTQCEPLIRHMAAFPHNGSYNTRWDLGSGNGQKQRAGVIREANYLAYIIPVSSEPGVYKAYVAEHDMDLGDMTLKACFLPFYVNPAVLTWSGNYDSPISFRSLVRLIPSDILTILFENHVGSVMERRLSGASLSVVPPQRRSLSSCRIAVEVREDLYSYTRVTSYLVYEGREILLTAVPPLFEREAFLLTPEGRIKTSMASILKGRVPIPKQVALDLKEIEEKADDLLQSLSESLVYTAG